MQHMVTEARTHMPCMLTSLFLVSKPFYNHDHC